MLTVYTLEQSGLWDSVVRSFAEYDVYWLSGYVKAFRIHGDGEPLLFYYEDKTVRGINVVMKRDIANDPHFAGVLDKGIYFDFATPYGYSGWLIEGDDASDLFDAYGKWCLKNGVVSEFVRSHPVIGNYAVSQPVYDVVSLGKTIALDLSSPEVIWENIVPKNRNMIRKAQKNGVTIFNGRYPEIFEKFREIYNDTMDRDSAAPYYYFKPEFYESILNDLPEAAQVFYAVYDGKVIAASIMLTANGRMNYHLSGYIRAFSSLAPTNLLLYEAALWGCANGCKTLHLGSGVGGREDNLFMFKKSFYRKDDLCPFLLGKRVYDEKKYADLVNMRNDLPGASFFPQYRA